MVRGVAFSPMLDQLFGSKTRVTLLRLFFDNPEQAYYVRELTRLVGAQINSVRRELDNLTYLGIVRAIEGLEVAQHEVASSIPYPKGLNKKKYYQLNRTFVLHDELSSLFGKSHLLLEKELYNEMKTLGDVSLLVLTGFFSNVSPAATDMLIVGSVNKQEAATMIKSFEQRLGREINYTIMPVKEFEYRRQLTDKFLYDILVNPKIVVVDQIGLNQ